MASGALEPPSLFGYGRRGTPQRSDLRPPAVRSEALTVTLRQLRKPLQHGVDAALAGVLQRTAAEWREAGAENDRGIDEIGIIGNLLAQAGDALVHEHEDQPVEQIRRCRPGCFRFDR